MASNYSHVALIGYRGEDPDGTATNAGDYSDRYSKVCDFYDDFLGDVGDTLPVPWDTDFETVNITGDYVSGAGAGVYRILCDSTSETQAGRLSWGDCLMLNMSKKPTMEARIKLTPDDGSALTASDRIVVGFASAHANAETDLDTATTNAWFRVEGTDMSVLVEADDGTTDTNDQDSTYDLTSGTWVVLKIDCSDLDDIKFYVDGKEQLGGKVSMGALAADTYVQPLICLQRTTGTEAHQLDIDYVHVTVER